MITLGCDKKKCSNRMPVAYMRQATALVIAISHSLALYKSRHSCMLTSNRGQMSITIFKVPYYYSPTIYYKVIFSQHL